MDLQQGHVSILCACVRSGIKVDSHAKFEDDATNGAGAHGEPLASQTERQTDPGCGMAPTSVHLSFD